MRQKKKSKQMYKELNIGKYRNYKNMYNSNNNTKIYKKEISL